MIEISYEEAAERLSRFYEDVDVVLHNLVKGCAVDTPFAVYKLKQECLD